MDKTHIWLRAETKPLEQRTALTPAGARILVGCAAGVDQVSLFEADRKVYGPMSLHPPTG